LARFTNSNHVANSILDAEVNVSKVRIPDLNRCKIHEL
jgi:hypothetical protein